MDTAGLCGDAKKCGETEARGGQVGRQTREQGAGDWGHGVLHGSVSGPQDSVTTEERREGARGGPLLPGASSGLAR